MIFSNGKRPNLDNGDIVRYQGRLAMIELILTEYDELAYEKMRLIYLDDNLEVITSWRFVDPVGDITAEELKAIMCVFQRTMAVSDAIAQTFAYQATRELQQERL
jgi:hypothetical protein